MPANLSAHFKLLLEPLLEPLLKRLEAQNAALLAAQQEIDKLKQMVSTIITQVSDHQHRLDDQEARLVVVVESQSGNRNRKLQQKLQNKAPSGGN